jgi:hypothetical protein
MSDRSAVGALHHLLRDRLDRTFPRQTLLRIHDQSGGNPSFALELGRALEADVDPLEPLPVPKTLEELLRVRIAGLPAATREALALASALGTASESLLEEAGISPEALDAASAAHVIERGGGKIRFAHPLLSSVLYHDLGEKRRGVHGRIARTVRDPLQKARHLRSRDGRGLVCPRGVRTAHRRACASQLPRPPRWLIEVLEGGQAALQLLSR